MPVMDGIEATRRVRQSPDLQDIVVIASSASAEFDVYRHGEGCSAWGLAFPS